MVQSMVPEVSLFFGDGDSYVPAVQPPQNGPAPARGPVPFSSGPRIQSYSSVPPKSVQNVPSSNAQKRTTAAADYVSNMTLSQNAPISTQTVHISSAQNRQITNNSGLPVSMQSDNVRSSQELSAPLQHSVRPPVPHPYQLSSSMPHPYSAPSSAANSYPPQINTQGHRPGICTQGPKPGFCTCPNCPRPPSQPCSIPPSYDLPRGPYPQRPVYNSYGQPQLRLQNPSIPHQPLSSYPVGQNQPQSFPQPPPSSATYPYQYPPTHFQQSYLKMPPVPENSSYPYQPNSGPQSHPSNGPYGGQADPHQVMQPLSTGMVNTATPPSPPQSLQGATGKQQVRAPPPLQTSGGLPTPSGNYSAAQRTPAQSNEFPQGVAEVRRSNQNSDNSGRSSDDSGLSFTPEKHNSPATVSPKAAQLPTSPATEVTAASLSLSSKGLNWENVPPEIYQLLLQQDQQLKQLQAQIQALTAQQMSQTLNNSGESGLGATNTLTKSPNPPGTEKCTIATNTSACFPEVNEKISECVQTSLQKQNHLQNGNVSQSSSGGSGCETRTPLEIRHRGRLPMNSTQREDVELDISQGELVAIVNNMHDRTIDSVQSDMIVDLPSFQSSPTR